MAFCGEMPLADETVTQFWFHLYGDGAIVGIGYMYGSAFAMVNPTGAGNLTDPSVVAQLPVANGEKFIVEMWSDGADIKARINGGAVSSLPWVGNKWPTTFNSVSTFITSNVGFPATGRAFEQHIALGAYPGDTACAAWRTYCAEKYGYLGA
jgi:hypothetical protein